MDRPQQCLPEQLPGPEMKGEGQHLQRAAAQPFAWETAEATGKSSCRAEPIGDRSREGERQAAARAKRGTQPPLTPATRAARARRASPPSHLPCAPRACSPEHRLPPRPQAAHSPGPQGTPACLDPGLLTVAEQGGLESVGSPGRSGAVGAPAPWHIWGVKNGLATQRAGLAANRALVKATAGQSWGLGVGGGGATNPPPFS